MSHSHHPLLSLLFFLFAKDVALAAVVVATCAMMRRATRANL